MEQKCSRPDTKSKPKQNQSRKKDTKSKPKQNQSKKKSHLRSLFNVQCSCFKASPLTMELLILKVEL